MHAQQSCSRRAFTIIEVLTIVGITGLLIGILMPALASSRTISRAIVSQSNLRQWGVGTANFAAVNRDLLPWEGFKGAPEMHLNFAEPSWWANAVPPFVGQKPYRELSALATAAQRSVPMPGDDSGSIFVDPSARQPEGAPHIGGLSGDPKQFFFCYVPNLQLNATTEIEATDSGHTDPVRMRLASLTNPSATILMLEMRTVKSELRADDPFYNFTLVRARSDWKRLAARHRDGGHVLFADGHVHRVDFKYATTNSAGTRNPDEPEADWNKPDLVWNPRGPAVEGPGS
jgi:prepilin-type processing-associated H-X9-DG protein